MTVFAGMEAIDTKDDVDQKEVVQEDITPVLFDLIDDESALAKDLLDVDQMLVAEEKFNTAFEQLEALRDSIEEFGLSKGVIKAVDPDGYLSANGIIPAYEELNDLPTKDEKAEAALESIGENIGKAWDKIKEFMIAFWNKIKGIFNRVIQMFQSYEKILANLSERLGKAKGFNDKKVKDKKVKFLSKTDLTAAFTFLNGDVSAVLTGYENAIKTLISAAESTPEGDIKETYVEEIGKMSNHADNLKKYVGMSSKIDGDKVSFPIDAKSSVYANIEKKEFKSIGYTSPADGKAVVDEALKFVKNKKIFETTVKDLDTAQKEFSKFISKAITDVKKEEGSKEKVKAIKENVSFVKNMVSSTIGISKSILVGGMKATKMAVAVGRTSLSVSE